MNKDKQPRSLHQLGIALVSYNKSAREWETETEEAGTLSFPAGKEGETAARWKAIELTSIPTFSVLKKLATNYPSLKTRAWKIGELVLNGHVELFPDADEEEPMAIVRSRTRDKNHQITFDGYHLRCTCEDYWSEHCPRIRWHSQRMCIHIGAYSVANRLRDEGGGYEPREETAATYS